MKIKKNEIAVEPKGPPSAVDQLFGWVWRPQTLGSPRGFHVYSPAKSDWKVFNETCIKDLEIMNLRYENIVRDPQIQFILFYLSMLVFSDTIG